MSFLLDTNILSEPARKKPNEKVMQRFIEHDGQYVTAAIVWHELHYGCALLPNSKRKAQLQKYLGVRIYKLRKFGTEFWLHRSANKMGA